MALIDWIILVGYLFISVSLGFVLASRNRNEDDYFIAGRQLTGWLAGYSCVCHIVPQCHPELKSVSL